LGELSIAPPAESFHMLVIEEFDEARLRRTCEALLARATVPASAESVDDALFAMEALTRVDHAIAVEYLVRSINAPVDLAASRALARLAEFATPDAIAALTVTSQKNAYLAEEAQRHLKRIRELEQNPALRERIRLAKEAAEADAQKRLR
jgi:hypothetical protein